MTTLSKFVRSHKLLIAGFGFAIALWLVDGKMGALNPPTVRVGSTLSEAIDQCHGKVPKSIIREADGRDAYDCDGNGTNLILASDD